MSLKADDVSTFMQKVKKQIEENNKAIEDLTKKNQVLKSSLDVGTAISNLFEKVPVESSEPKTPPAVKKTGASKKSRGKDKSVPQHIQDILRGRKTGLRTSEIMKELQKKGLEGSDSKNFKPRIYQAVKNLYDRGLIEAHDTGQVYAGRQVYTYTLA